jgi:hypothetical protein
MARDGCILEIFGFLLGREKLDVLLQRFLIALEGDDIVSFIVFDLPGGSALTADGADGDDTACDRHPFEQRGDSDDHVGRFGHGELSHDQPLPGGEGRNRLDRRLDVLLRTGAAEVLPSMATTSAGALINAETQATKQCPKGLSVEPGENVAVVIIRQSPGGQTVESGAGERASSRQNARCR